MDCFGLTIGALTTALAQSADTAAPTVVTLPTAVGAAAQASGAHAVAGRFWWAGEAAWASAHPRTLVGPALARDPVMLPALLHEALNRLWPALAVETRLERACAARWVVSMPAAWGLDRAVATAVATTLRTAGLVGDHVTVVVAPQALRYAALLDDTGALVAAASGRAVTVGIGGLVTEIGVLDGTRWLADQLASGPGIAALLQSLRRTLPAACGPVPLPLLLDALSTTPSPQGAHVAAYLPADWSATVQTWTNELLAAVRSNAEADGPVLVGGEGSAIPQIMAGLDAELAINHVAEPLGALRLARYLERRAQRQEVAA